MSGIAGIWSKKPAIGNILSLLYGLQHRGTKYAGIAIAGKKKYFRHSGEGLLKEVFKSPKTFQEIEGNSGIGIVGNRICMHSTNTLAQPVYVSFRDKSMAVCFSGVLTNYAALRNKLELQGAILATDSFAEIIPHLASRAQKEDIVEGIIEAIAQLEGSFSLVVLTPDHLIAARDAFGNRPFSLGVLPRGGYVVASENVSFDDINARMLREIVPGEVLVIGSKGLFSHSTQHQEPLALCILELINMAAASSSMFDRDVSLFRKMLGAKMGGLERLKADSILPSPKARDFALGFSEATDLPLVFAIMQNTYVMRDCFFDAGSFLSSRFSLNEQLLRSGDVFLCDDIMQSFRTAKHIAKMLDSCTKIDKIHLRAFCPPVDKGLCPFQRSPNFVDDADYELLRKVSLPDFLGVDSFHFLSLETLKKNHRPGSRKLLLRLSQRRLGRTKHKKGGSPTRGSRPFYFGGPEETRTPHLLYAKQALYQMSYGPSRYAP